MSSSENVGYKFGSWDKGADASTADDDCITVWLLKNFVLEDRPIVLLYGTKQDALCRSSDEIRLKLAFILRFLPV